MTIPYTLIVRSNGGKGSNCVRYSVGHSRHPAVLVGADGGNGVKGAPLILRDSCGSSPPADLPPVSSAGGGRLDCIFLLNSGFISGHYPSYLMSVKINLRVFLSIFLRRGGKNSCDDTAC